MAKGCYFIECSDKTAFQQEVLKLVKKCGFQDETITYYDLEESTLSQVLEDLDTYSFLTPRKVVVITNALFLTAITDVKFSDSELEHILKYLQNPNPDVLFIMGVSKCDERKKIVKEVKKFAEKISIDINTDSVLKEVLEGYKVSKETMGLILEYCGDDIGKLTKECEKLKMYAIDSLEIKREDVEEIVVKKIPDTDKLAFDFVKYIALRDKKHIFEYYDILKGYSFEPHSMIGLIESQVKLIYQVLLAKRKGMRKDEIAKYLKEHPFRIQKTLEFLPLYQEKDLQQLIHKMHQLDYKIKSGKVDATLGFEVFLLQL